MANAKAVKEVYYQVVLDVINGVREAFLDEGIDEQVLLELKQLWESKLSVSKALEVNEPRVMQQTPLQHSSRAPVIHQQQVQLHHAAAAAAQTATLQHMNPPVHIVGITSPMAASVQAANALPQGLFQQIEQQRLQHQPYEYCLQPSGAQGQQQQLLVPGGLGSQFTLVPATQTDPSQLNTKPVMQLDGLGDSSSDDENQDDDDDDDDNDEANDDAAAEEEDPLNSGDDVSDADPTEVFDAENVIVCQFDKINRSKNKWKFHLKDGIMNVNGKDQLFMKATGDAEW